MKKAILFTVMAVMSIAVMAQQVKKVKKMGKGWVELGITTVDYKVDRDVVTVKGADWFRKLKFKVVDAPLEMLDMKVVYENEEVDDIPLRFLIKKGGESRLIDLKGRERRIKRVEFVYKTPITAMEGNAKVILFGTK